MKMPAFPPPRNWGKTLPGYAWFLGAWLVVMILTPILDAIFGAPARPWVISAGVLLQLLTVLAILSQQWPPQRTLTTTAAVFLLAWGVEAIGSTTGLPFGRYAYTPTLQPQIRHVPLIIPLAWMMMLPPAWAVGSRIARGSGGLRFALASGLAFTAWDFFLDPQMVHWGFWVWQEPGGYFGIPWLNYLGWFIVASLLTLILRPHALPVRPLLLIYTITWALETIGLILFWGLIGPGLVGGLVMGGMLAWAYATRKDTSPLTTPAVEVAR